MGVEGAVPCAKERCLTRTLQTTTKVTQGRCRGILRNLKIPFQQGVGIEIWFSDSADALEETAGSASVGERRGAAAAPLGRKQTPQDQKRQPNAVGASSGGGSSSSSSRSGSCGKSDGRVSGKSNNGGGGGGGTLEDDAGPPGRPERTRAPVKRFKFATYVADDSARRKSKEK